MAIRTPQEMLAQALSGQAASGRSFAADPRTRSALGMMETGSSTAPVHGWAEGLARMLQAPIGAMQLGGIREEYDQREGQERTRIEAAETRRRSELAQLLTGDPQEGMRAPVDTAGLQQPPAASPRPSVPVGRAAATPAGGFLDRLGAEENGTGDPAARNPRSTATGNFQFIDGTWREYAAANPDRFQGMTPEQVLARRSDPAESRNAAQWYSEQNGRALSVAGLPNGPAELAMGHRFGPQGAVALLRADPGAPVERVFGADVIRANPELAGQTVEQLRQGFRSRYGGGQAPAGGGAPGGVQLASGQDMEQPMGAPGPVNRVSTLGGIPGMQIPQSAASPARNPLAVALENSIPGAHPADGPSPLLAQALLRNTGGAQPAPDTTRLAAALQVAGGGQDARPVATAQPPAAGEAAEVASLRRRAAYAAGIGETATASILEQRAGAIERRVDAAQANALRVTERREDQRNSVSSRAPQEIRTAEGVFLRHPDGRIERMGSATTPAGVTVNNRGETEFEKEQGKAASASLEALRTASTRGTDTIRRLDQFERQLDQFRTGAGATASLSVGRIAQALGMTDDALKGLGLSRDQVASGEQLQSLTSQMLTGLLGSGGFPSNNFSNADREALERSLPGLANTPGGNRQLLGVLREGARREAEVGQAWRQWERDNGGGLESFRNFQRERLPEIQGRDVLTTLLPQDASPAAEPGAVPGPGGRGTATPPPPAGSGARSVRTAAEAAALPPGTVYSTPDGRTFRR